jgi:hypothetical protein
LAELFGVKQSVETQEEVERASLPIDYQQWCRRLADDEGPTEDEALELMQLLKEPGLSLAQLEADVKLLRGRRNAEIWIARQPVDEVELKLQNEEADRRYRKSFDRTDRILIASTASTLAGYRSTNRAIRESNARFPSLFAGGK